MCMRVCVHTCFSVHVCMFLVCACVSLCSHDILLYLTLKFEHSYEMSFKMCLFVRMCVCMCVRAHAGDSEGFLEDGLAGKLGLYRHGYQSCGGGQGEFIIKEIKKLVYVCLIIMKRPDRYQILL